MQEYKRKFERAQHSVHALELERKQCEARLGVVDMTWNQVSLLRSTCLTDASFALTPSSFQLVLEADMLLPSTSSAPNGASAGELAFHVLGESIFIHCSLLSPVSCCLGPISERRTIGGGSGTT